MRLKTLIIDDEPLAQKGMAEYIQDTPFLYLAGKAEDPTDAFAILSNQTVDLIFLDIEMPRMSGMAFLRLLKNPPIIIIASAYKDYALEGYELAILDYLVKPIPYERFLKAALKAQEYYNLTHKSLNEPPFSDSYFFVKSQNKIEKIDIADLLFIEAESNYVTFHTKQRKLLSYLTLKNVMTSLPMSQFVRIHKSYVVALDKIQSIDMTQLKIGTITLPLSRNYRDDLMVRIEEKTLKR
jgi:DNA-binding LytR/AlgR family response regulator